MASLLRLSPGVGATPSNGLLARPIPVAARNLRLEIMASPCAVTIIMSFLHYQSCWPVRARPGRPERRSGGTLASVFGVSVFAPARAYNGPGQPEATVSIQGRGRRPPESRGTRHGAGPHHERQRHG